MVDAEAADYATPFKHMTLTPLVTFKNADTNNSNEQDGIASNGKMIAVNWASSASIAVFNAEKPLNFDARVPLLKGHSGAIFDMQWNPFEDRLLATCADDGKVKLWVFDDYEGLTSTGHRNDPDMELEAHARKCASVQWHEAAENLLFTHGADKTLKIWDINEDRCDDPIFTFTNMPDMVTSARWSPSGNRIGGALKNKHMLIVDPR